MSNTANILLVDDEPGMQRYIKTLLEVDDYKVETASTGEEALERVQKGLQPDLVLLDVLMPGIDGLTLVTRELGSGEAHDATAYYLPHSRDLYIGDAVLNRLHGPIADCARRLAHRQRLAVDRQAIVGDDLLAGHEVAQQPAGQQRLAAGGRDQAGAQGSPPQRVEQRARRLAWSRTWLAQPDGRIDQDQVVHQRRLQHRRFGRWSTAIRVAEQHHRSGAELPQCSVQPQRLCAPRVVTARRSMAEAEGRQVDRDHAPSGTHERLDAVAPGASPRAGAGGEHQQRGEWLAMLDHMQLHVVGRQPAAHTRGRVFGRCAFDGESKFGPRRGLNVLGQ